MYPFIISAVLGIIRKIDGGYGVMVNTWGCGPLDVGSIPASHPVT